MDPYKRQRLIELTRRWLDFVEEHPRLELPEINSAPMFNGLRLAVSACVRTPHELLAWLDALQSPGITDLNAIPDARVRQPLPQSGGPVQTTETIKTRYT